MSGFLSEYGLFLAKSLTIILGVLTVVAFSLSMVVFKKKGKEDGYLEIENINDKLEDLQDSLESEILTKQEYKKLQKVRKKEKKLEEKSKKQLAKQQDNTDKEESEKPRIFVLKFNGDLTASQSEHLREEITAVLTVTKKNDEVLVIIDSNGGIVHNYGFAAAQLQRIKQNNINLVVGVDLVAASGGYMMACVANKIIAAPFAIVGSIGVMAQIPNFNKLLEKHNIDIEHHTSGEYKTTLTMFGKNTEKGREKFIAELEDTHKLFKEFIKNNRSKIDLKKVATGEYWYGIQALELELIDEVITSDSYLMQKSKDYDIYTLKYTIPESFKEKISNIFSKTTNYILEKLTCVPMSQSSFK